MLLFWRPRASVCGYLGGKQFHKLIVSPLEFVRTVPIFATLLKENVVHTRTFDDLGLELELVAVNVDVVKAAIAIVIVVHQPLFFGSLLLALIMRR